MADTATATHAAVRDGAYNLLRDSGINPVEASAEDWERACYTVRVQLRRRPTLALCDFADLHHRFTVASDVYASTDDGGYPGTAAAQAYHAELDACYAEAVVRIRRLFCILFAGVAA